MEPQGIWVVFGGCFRARRVESVVNRIGYVLEKIQMRLEVGFRIFAGKGKTQVLEGSPSISLRGLCINWFRKQTR